MQEEKMMSVRKITGEQLPAVRGKLIRFFKLHGDKRITSRALAWFESLPPADLKKPENLILIYVEEKRLLGCLAVADYGIKESFIAIHQEARQLGIAKLLVEYTLDNTEKLYARVALDNIPSMKTCFAVGMVGFSCITGPTGKPTVWMGAGNWRKEDVEP
jgi:hypothetical protein